MLLLPCSSLPAEDVRASVELLREAAYEVVHCEGWKEVPALLKGSGTGHPFDVVLAEVRCAEPPHTVVWHPSRRTDCPWPVKTPSASGIPSLGSSELMRPAPHRPPTSSPPWTWPPPFARRRRRRQSFVRPHAPLRLFCQGQRPRADTLVARRPTPVPAAVLAPTVEPNMLMKAIKARWGRVRALPEAALVDIAQPVPCAPHVWSGGRASACTPGTPQLCWPCKLENQHRVADSHDPGPP